MLTTTQPQQTLPTLMQFQVGDNPDGAETDGVTDGDVMPTDAKNVTERLAVVQVGDRARPACRTAIDGADRRHLRRVDRRHQHVSPR